MRFLVTALLSSRLWYLEIRNIQLGPRLGMSVTTQGGSGRQFVTGR